MSESLVGVSGMRELARTLTDLPVRLQGKVMQGALRAGQSVFRAAARERLVAEGAVDTRALYKSLRIANSRRAGRYGWVRMRLIAGNRLPPEHPGSAFYAHLIEFGTGAFYTGSGKSSRRPYKIGPKKGRRGAVAFDGKVRAGVMHPGVRPTRFMRHAFDSKNREALDAVAAYLRGRLPRELERMRRR